MTTAEPLVEQARARAGLEHAHDVLVLLLVFLRPLCWDGAPGQVADLVWQALAVAGLMLVAVERATLLRTAWTWSWRGVLGLVLLAALLPCTLYAPEPGPAWCRFAGWTSCMAAAVYLMQVLPGRVRLAIAALLAALAIESVLGVVQRWWGLPSMVEAQRAGDPAFAAIGQDVGDVAERLAHGGAYATFTLANQFGAYLALCLPLAVGAMVVYRGYARVLAVSVVVLGLVALCGASVKGAWLALACGVGTACFCAISGRWRWLLLILGVLSVVAIGMSHLADDSMSVRWGYWRAAVTLIQRHPWSGFGLDSFGANQPQVMVAGDGPTQSVHNEPLEAALSGGVWLGLLGLVSLITLAWPRRALEQAFDVPPRTVHTAAFWSLAFIVPYLACFGAFYETLGWWPGRPDVLAVLGWALLLGTVATGCCFVLRHMPVLPSWSWVVALTAVATKACIDFDFHAGGVLGTALIVACCAPGRERLATGVWSRWSPAMLATMALAIVVVGAMTGRHLNQARDWISSARMVGLDARQAAALARDLGVPEQAPAALTEQAALRAWNLADGAPSLRLQALWFMPSSRRATNMAGALAEEMRSNSSAHLQYAYRLLGEQRWHDAVRAARRATEVNPNSPGNLLRVAEIFAQAAAHVLSGAVELMNVVDQLRREARRLNEVVYPTLRIPERNFGPPVH